MSLYHAKQLSFAHPVQVIPRERVLPGYSDLRLSAIDGDSYQPRLARWCTTATQRDAMLATAPN